MAQLVGLTGTPGTGKTTVADHLDRDERRIIDLTAYARDEGLVGDDGDVDVRDLDILLHNDLADAAGTVVLEGHLAHHVSDLDLIVVLRCRPRVLVQRLKARDWTEEKIRENAEAEALGVIADEARGRAPRVLEVETAGKEADEVAATVQAILEDPTSERFKSLEVGWVDHLDEVLDWY